MGQTENSPRPRRRTGVPGQNRPGYLFESPNLEPNEVLSGPLPSRGPQVSGPGWGRGVYTGPLPLFLFYGKKGTLRRNCELARVPVFVHRTSGGP